MEKILIVLQGKRGLYIVLAALLVMAIVAAVLIFGRTSVEDELVGEWINEDKWSDYFELFEDGTCESSNTYGTGTWTVLGGNTLKITDYYGDTTTVRIVSVTKDYLTLDVGHKEEVYISEDLMNEKLAELFSGK